MSLIFKHNAKHSLCTEQVQRAALNQSLVWVNLAAIKAGFTLGTAVGTAERGPFCALGVPLEEGRGLQVLCLKE